MRKFIILLSFFLMSLATNAQVWVNLGPVYQKEDMFYIYMKKIL